MSALETQVAGSHYKDLKIQPIEYIHANGIPFAEGCVIKYVSRWRAKGGVKDLEKARHFIDLLIELETRLDVQPKPAELGEWIKWVGGECPVDPSVRVDVLLRDGTPLSRPAGVLSWAAWAQRPPEGGIVAYRVAKT